MIKRAYRSISYRIGVRYRETLGKTYRSAVARRGYAEVPPKPSWDVTLLLYAGAGQSAMLRESLWSIYHAWPKLPTVKLVSDGTIDPAALLELIAWWPGAKSAESWETAADYHAARGRADVRAFANGNMLGKKLSAILAAGEHGPALYCDSDLLWVSGPPRLPDPAGAVVQLAVDLYRYYDNDLLRELAITELDEPPWLNTGMVFVSGLVYETCGLERLLRVAARKPAYFSEQTIMSFASRKLGGRHWNSDEVVLKVDDKYWPIWPRGPREYRTARHFVGDVRHWFWRDALWLRKQDSPDMKVTG
jgi:hypothetical protein